MDTIVALRDQHLHIMEYLYKVCSDVRGQTVGVDMDYPSTISPIMANLAATLSNALRVSINVLWEALVPFAPA